MSPVSGHVSHLVAALGLLGLAVPSAHAAAMPSYTVTDLGAGVARLAKDAAGDGIVVAPDGQTDYAFPKAQDTSGLDVQATLKALPPLTNAPVHDGMTYGNPNNAFSYFVPQGVFLSNDGVFVGTDVYGVYGHIASAGSTVFMAQRQPDGSFGAPMSLWGSPNNYYTGGQIAQALDMNSHNQVLGVTSYAPTSYNIPPSIFLLYDINAGKSTDLGALLPDWHMDSALALDDQGRILVTADSGATDHRVHSLLLTPAGALSDPTPVPEPSALATLMLGLGWLASRRLRRRIG